MTQKNIINVSFVLESHLPMLGHHSQQCSGDYVKLGVPPESINQSII